MNQKFGITIAGKINLGPILYGSPQITTLERDLFKTRFQFMMDSSSAIPARNLAISGAKAGFVIKVGKGSLDRIALSWLDEKLTDISHA